MFLSGVSLGANGLQLTRPGVENVRYGRGGQVGRQIQVPEGEDLGFKAFSSPQNKRAGDQGIARVRWGMGWRGSPTSLVSRKETHKPPGPKSLDSPTTAAFRTSGHWMLWCQ